MEKNLSSKILNNVVLIGIVLTLLALLMTPLILTAFLKSSLSITGTNIVTIISICIYMCAAPYIISLFELKKLCKLISKNNPFSTEIPKSLKKIAICAFSEVLLFNGTAIILFYVYDIYLYALTIIPCIIVSIVSIVIGLLGLVLSRLFQMVIEIKDENDKTI